MIQDLSYYESIAQEEIDDDDNKKKRRQWLEIDNMYNGEWSAPKELRTLSWWKTVKTTAPHDALDAPTRVLSNLMPKINIIPNNASDQESERVERLETALLWHLEKSNRRSVMAPLRKIVHHSLRYAAIAAQVKYMPYYTKGMKKDSRLKSMKSASDFTFVVHNPHTVYPRYSDYGLESVVVASLRTAFDVVKEYGRENEGIKTLLTQVKDEDLRSTNVAFFDYTDWEDRVIWFTVSDSVDIAHGGIEIMREEHKLTFLPWVIRYDEHPLLKPVVDNNLYEITNILLSLRYAQVVALAAAPKTKSQTSTGEGIEMDYDDPAGQAKLKPGESLDPLTPPRLDPELTNIAALAEQYMYQATSSKILGSLEQVAGASTPFSTINAMIQTALAQLGRYTNLAENALVDSLYLMLRWIDYSGDSLLSRVPNGKNSNITRGAQVILKPASQLDEGFEEDGIITPFDPDELNIRVTLRSDSSNDQQARMNLAILATERFNMAPQDAADMFDLEYTDIHKNRWTHWMFEKAEVEGNVFEIQSDFQFKASSREAAFQQELQMQAQQAMQQQQMQQQQMQQGPPQGMMQGPQQSPMNDMRQQRSNVPAAEGVDNRGMGGAPTPPQTQTREQVTQQAPGGEDLAL
jgi:hypothetical protein